MQIDQRSPDWFAVRCGRVTASRVADVIAKTKSGYSTSRANYAAQLVCERLTGTVEPSYSNAAMQWGTDKEPDARDAYAFENVVAVEAGGFHRPPAHYALWRVPGRPGGRRRDAGDKVPQQRDAHRHAAERHHRGQIHRPDAMADGVRRAPVVRLRKLRSAPAARHADLYQAGRSRRRPHRRIGSGGAGVSRGGRKDGRPTQARYGAEIPWTPSVLEAA
jgi:hypothetical protein